MSKILFVANIPEHLSTFHYPYMKWFKDIGWEVHVATSPGVQLDYCDKQVEISVKRNPFHFSNVKAFWHIKKLLESEKYDLVHCHTAVPSILTILAARNCRRKNNTKVIHTVHGFWFFKGAPIKNWIFYPITRYCSRFIDCLITINHEDYELAKEKMKSSSVFLVNGVGFKNQFLSNITELKRTTSREKIGIENPDTIMLLSVGELNNNKNHRIVIEALGELTDSNFIYYIAGEGELEIELKKLIEEKSLGEKVVLLGYRDDIEELLYATDIFVFMSMREGLPVSVMEAMASSLPCIVSNIRGNNDLIDENGGILVNNDAFEIRCSIEKLMLDKKLRDKMGKYNREKSINYSLEKVLPEMQEIYKSMMLE